MKHEMRTAGASADLFGSERCQSTCDAAGVR